MGPFQELPPTCQSTSCSFSLMDWKFRLTANAVFLYVFIARSRAGLGVPEVGALIDFQDLTMIQGYPCGINVFNSLPGSDVLRTGHPRECDNLCVETEGCLSFLWSRADSNCNLYPFEPSHQCYVTDLNLFWFKRGFVAAKQNFTQYFTLTKSNGYGSETPVGFLTEGNYDGVHIPACPLASCGNQASSCGTQPGACTSGVPKCVDVVATCQEGVAICENGHARCKKGVDHCENWKNVPAYNSFISLDRAKGDMVFFVSKETCDSRGFQPALKQDLDAIKTPAGVFFQSLKEAVRASYSSASSQPISVKVVRDATESVEMCSTISQVTFISLSWEFANLGRSLLISW